MKRILLVDDHTIVRSGVIRLMSDLLPFEAEFVEAANGTEAFDALSLHRFDLVLLDISLPGRNGLDILRQMQLSRPDLPVLVLSMYPDEQYAVRALRAGAAGYVTKDSAAEILREAVETALAGRRHITRDQADLLAEAISERYHDAEPHKLLSDREYQFACLLAAGRTMTQIAEELSLSVKTVSTYRARVLEKLHLKTNAEIINYCVTRGMIL